MSEELNELDQLAGAAAAVDNMAEAGADYPGAPAAPQPVDQSAEVAALLLTVSGLLSPIWPSIAGIYTKQTCDGLGAAAAPVLAKYELSVGGFFDKWGAEIGLAAAALPVAAATWQGIKADNEARRKKPEPEKPQGVQVQGQEQHQGAVMVVG